MALDKFPALHTETTTFSRRLQQPDDLPGKVVDVVCNAEWRPDYRIYTKTLGYCRSCNDWDLHCHRLQDLVLGT